MSNGSQFEETFHDYWYKIMYNVGKPKKCPPGDARRVVYEPDPKTALKFLKKKLKDTIPPLKYKGVDAVPLYITNMEGLALLALLEGYIGDG